MFILLVVVSLKMQKNKSLLICDCCNLKIISNLTRNQNFLKLSDDSIISVSMLQKWNTFEYISVLLYRIRKLKRV